MAIQIFSDLNLNNQDILNAANISGGGGGGGGGDLVKGLAAYWKLDEASGIRADSSGNGNYLEDNNTVTSQPGLFGNEAVFTAANSEYLSTPTGTNTVFQTDQSFTISGWVTTNTLAQDFGIFWNYDAGAVERKFFVQYINATSEVRSVISPDGNNTDVLGSGINLTTGQRTFVCASYDLTTNTHTLWVDSVKVTSTPATPGLHITSADLVLGCQINNGSPLNFLDGALDEVGYWSRALTDEEVAQLYNSGSGLSFDDPSFAGSGGGTSGGREVLTANRTYYVDPAGSDSNDGLTVGNPFQTIQKAIDTAAGLDFSIYDVTIQLADGTYPTATSNICKQGVGSGRIIIQGNNGTPSNVKLEITAISVYAFSISNISTVYVIKDLEVDINNATTGGGITGQILSKNSYIEVENTVSTATNGVGKTIQWFKAEDNGNINVTGNLTFDDWSGTTPSNYNAFAVNSSSVIRCQFKVITLLNTPDFLGTGGFVDVSRSGVCFLNGTTYSGTAVGRRFTVQYLGFLQAGAGGANLPGDVAGFVDAATYGVVI